MVPQCETFSPENQDFLMQLRTFCDTVLHTYLSKIADTAEKRSYLHVLYTAADVSRTMGSFEGFLNDMTQILELYPPTFQPCAGNPLVLINTARRWDDWFQANYLRDFLRNPQRSKLFHYDPELWSTVVAARCMRHLRTPSNIQ